MNRLISFTKRAAKYVIYRPRGVEMGRDSYIMRPRWLYNPERIHMGVRCWIGRFSVFNPLVQYEGEGCDGAIRLGDDVYIGGFCQIHSMHSLEIGDGSVLSEHVYISDIAHGLNPDAGLIMRQPIQSKGPVRIGRHVFIGFGVSILPGVTLGDHCVVGTRSVLTHSFPGYSMVAGSPARLIKTFDPKSRQWVPVARE